MEVKKLNEFLSNGFIDVMPKKKEVEHDTTGDYFLIVWHEGGDEIHFLLMDMIHYRVVDKAIPTLASRESPKDKKWSDIISSRNEFLENFMAFCEQNQTFLKGRRAAYWIQSYCDEAWPFNGYNIERIIYIPEFGM